MKSNLLPVSLLLASMAAGLIACAQREVTPHPVTEAYTLLDQGERARAIVLMETFLEREPGHVEAKVVLASAYAGEAGIDIYSLHSAFQDILFTESLDGALWRDEEEEAQKKKAAFSEEVPGRVAEEPTPADKAFHKLDIFLNGLRRSVILINRFPRIKEEDWPLLEKALALLDPIEARRDVSFYRLFLRMTFMKEHIQTKFLGDEHLFSIQWFCARSVHEILDKTNWMAKNLLAATSDYKFIYPDKASPFDGANKALERATRNLEIALEMAPPGASIASISLKCKVL